LKTPSATHEITLKLSYGSQGGWDSLIFQGPEVIRERLNAWIHANGHSSRSEFVKSIAIPEVNMPECQGRHVILGTGSRNDLIRLLRLLEDWDEYQRAEEAEIWMPSYPVLIRSVQTCDVNLRDQHATVRKMLAENTILVNAGPIVGVEWFRPRDRYGEPPSQKASLLIRFLRPKDANKFIQAGLKLNCNHYKCVRMFYEDTQIQQCERCWSYEHFEALCRFPERCRECAECHDEWACDRGEADGPFKCAVCGLPHPANSEDCLYRQSARSKASQAKEDLKDPARLFPTGKHDISPHLNEIQRCLVFGFDYHVNT